MMSVPSHLRDILIPRESMLGEESLIGDVICHCGNRELIVLYPGKTNEYEGRQIPCTAQIDGAFFFRISVICLKCGDDHLLFDKDFHGWDGFVCHDAEQAALPRPKLVPWYCMACNASEHELSIKINSQGKDDFVDATEGSLDVNRWPDAFEWIWITIKCCNCGFNN